MTADSDQAFASARTRGAGRPRDPGMRDAILDAARGSFLTKGFSASTVEGIAADAGVSKVTVYNRIGDKGALFEAMVRRQAEYMIGALEEAQAGGGTLTRQLNAFGERLLSFLFHPDHVAMEAILALEFAEYPDLARRFFEAGPGNCRQRLAEELARAGERGELVLTDPIAASEDLMSLWKGFFDFQLRLNVVDPPGAEAIAARVERGTALFLKLYGAE